MRLFQRMAEFPVHGDAVVISSPDASALDVPLGDEVGDDRLGRRSVMPTRVAMSRPRSWGRWRCRRGRVRDW